MNETQAIIRAFDEAHGQDCAPSGHRHATEVKPFECYDNGICRDIDTPADLTLSLAASALATY